VQVASLHIYPIKGCRARAVSTVEIDRLGLVGDRRLMLVDADGVFLSQRADPQLATIAPELDGPMLTVHHEGIAPLALELDPDGPIRAVRIWSSAVDAVDQGDAAAAWFSSVIGRAIRLVWFAGPSRRPIDPAFTPRADAETAFTDGYPMLVVTEKSLADLNGRLEAAVPMSRFRPNVAVSGGTPWCEDAWRGLTIGSLACDAVKPCARCLVPTTDQVTGVQHPAQEPLRTLAGFRTQQPFGAIFGQNVVPRGPGRIAVGDAVTLLPIDR
jgi:uncharacterized protein YcbX